MRWIFLCFVILLLISCATEPVPAGNYTTPIELFNTPEMIMVSRPETLRMQINGIDFEIKLKASYVIGAIVLSKREYSGTWQAKIAPVDLALVWGELLKDDMYKKIRWWQEARWYHWTYSADFPKDNIFIAKYSSNNHIIPASDNILNVLRKIRKGDTLELSGYLVDINGRKNSDSYWWYSSTSTNDTGDGSCEVIYLRKIKVWGRVYE